MKSHRQPGRALPVILPPLADELLSSWIHRHAAFVGVSSGRLLRHYDIDTSTARELDLSLSCRQAGLLAEVLRCSPHLIRNMTQSRGGRVRSRLVAITQPSQICRACSHRHAVDVRTRGTRLRNWMEGWRITCPICGGALEDFRLYRRLFRADPSGVLLARFGGSARKGEQVMDRASRQRGVSSAYDVLMRSLLFPQAGTGTREAPMTPRLLSLVVPESAEFFHRLPAENWPCSSRLLPLSVRIPVLAGVAVVSSCPDYWLERLLGAAMPAHQACLLRCVGTLAAAGA